MQNLESVPVAVSVSEFKDSLHLPAGYDDATAEIYLAAAQEVVEQATGRLLGSRSVEITGRAGFGARWWLPCVPVTALTSLSARGEDGQLSDLDLTGVVLEQGGEEPQIVFPSGFFDGVPDGAELRLVVDAGYADPVAPPLPLRQAIKLIAKDWYEAGIAVEERGYINVTFGCRVLIRSNRYRRPQEWGTA